MSPNDDVVAVWRCLLMAYSSSCRFALLRLRAALFLFASVFNYREDVALLLCALHCNQQDSPDDNNSGLRVSLYLWKRTYSSLKTVKNIMFAGVFMCPKNRTEVNISPVCRGGNAQNRAVNDTGRLRETVRRSHEHGGYSSVGRASDCGSEGRAFKPRYPPH